MAKLLQNEFHAMPRRNLSCAFVESVKTTVGLERPDVALKEAAKAWALKQKLVLGTWSTAREQADDSWVVTARCHQHEACYQVSWVSG